MLEKARHLATVILAAVILSGCTIRIALPPTPSPPVFKFPPTVTPEPPATISLRQPPTISTPSPAPISGGVPATSAPPKVGDAYADRVASFKPGNPTSARFNDPEATLGRPDFNEAALSGFLTLGVGGSITVEFVDNIAVDGPGPDIEIYGDPNDDEMWIGEVSADCVNFKSFGKVRERAKLDLATVGLTSARCVRLTDDGDPAGGASPGAELDAIVALNSAAP